MDFWTIVMVMAGTVIIVAIVYGAYCWHRIPDEAIRASRATVDFYEQLGKLYKTLGTLTKARTRREDG